MHVRVVRFTDVTAARIDGLLARIEESDGPPPGAPATGLKLLFDQAQGTAVVLQYFETAQDMNTGGQAFSAMDLRRLRDMRLGGHVRSRSSASRLIVGPGGRTPGRVDRPRSVPGPCRRRYLMPAWNTAGALRVAPRQ